MGKASRQKSRTDKARRRAKRLASRPARGSQGFSAGPPPSFAEVVAETIGEAVQSVCHGARDSADRFVALLAAEDLGPGWSPTVSHLLTGALRSGIQAAWRHGWQPLELARHVGRVAGASCERIVAGMMADEMRGYAAATVDDRWAAQLGALGGVTGWGNDAEYVQFQRELAGGADAHAVIAAMIEVLHLLQHLQVLERLCPLPGEARAGAGRMHSDADERVLSKIRALLAKAESTEFPEEAEALSARAQELMAKYSIDHALLAATAGRTEEPGGRRLMIDNPYEEPKATLLQTIAAANRCRTIWHKELGMSTVVGFPADLDAVELLFTSLLVQANSAMLREGAKRDAYGRSRTRAFRQSFLISYTVRIGERLSEAAGNAEQAAAASSGRDLLPVLAARHEAVDDAVDAMFGDTLIHRGRSARATDAEGWHSGRLAADLATLHNREQVAATG
jgi:hypothetical protein